MADKRVVITGLGVVNALGIGAREYQKSLLAGEVGIDKIKSYDAVGFPSQIAGEAERPRLNKIVPKVQRKSAKLMSRDIGLAVIAADEAVRDSGLKTRADNPEGPIDIDPTRSGVNIGAGAIGCDLEEMAAATSDSVVDGKFSLKVWGEKGMEQLTPLWLLKYLPNMLSCHVSIIYDLQGPSNSITCGEASGMLAINEACRHIAHGRAEVMITGGAETKVHPMALTRQCMLGRASTHYNDNPQAASRPFDRAADGNVVAEGGGIMVLEELEFARKRGAKIYGELVGFGSSSMRMTDFTIPEADGRGMVIAMRNALEQSGLQAGDIDLLVAEGLAVPQADKAEAAAIRTIFGDGAADLPVLATKSRIGNCGAGGAAIDMVTAALAIYDGKVAPNLNCPDVPEEYGINLSDKLLEKELNNVMVNCYSYGGQTATAIIRKFQD